ncbi:MAG: hypothetical protein WBQ60_04070 [Asticcacaulis sp.]
MTHTTLKFDRFKAIVEAYGASPMLWPDSEREAALKFMDAHAEKAQACLAEARVLDDMFDKLKQAEQVYAHADQALFEATMARFSPVNNVVNIRPSEKAAPSSHPVLWRVGIGIAACLAGAIIGTNLSMNGLSDIRTQTVLEQVAMLDGDN